MSDLAFNINGETFEVPANATGWRVRKMRAKGSPEVVYSREGQPLVLPIGADIEELRAEVDTTGRYRLDLVDQDNKAIPGAPSGYVQVNFETTPASCEGPTVSTASFGKPTDNIVLEAMRMQSMIAVSVVERFPQMMEAAATLLRAADGAGLPARPGMAVVDDEDDETDDDEDDDEGKKNPASMLDMLQPMVGPAMQYLVTGFTSGQLKLPGNFAEIFDWRRAAARGKKPKTDASTPAPASTVETATEPLANGPSAPAAPKFDMKDAAHFVKIQEALGSDAAFARRAAANLPPEQVDAWLQQLGKLSVEDAVARVREEIAKSNAGGAS